MTLPQVHIVRFDSSSKIQQIRLYWDQGSLLKQVEVIGARAKNWPIRDGKDQLRLIASSAASEFGSRPSTAASSNAAQEANSGKPRSQSNNVTRDPHASLALFAPREENLETIGQRVTAPKGSAKPPPRPYGDLFVGDDSDAEARGRSRSPQKAGSIVAPKAQTAKPPPRDYHDLFVGEESPSQAPAPAAQGKASSPSKSALMSPPIAPKSGAGKNYKPSRLFGDGEDEDAGTPKARDKGNYMKPNPKKYHHFEFGHGDDAPAPQLDRPKTKHQSQWDFEDFVTPQKPPSRQRNGDQASKNFGWEDNEAPDQSPVKQAASHKPRPDSDTHFQLQDDGSSNEHRRIGSALGGTHLRTNGLYESNFGGENDGTGSGGNKNDKSLSSITNLKDRRKDFDPHFDMTDQPSDHDAGGKKPVPAARAKVVNQMGAQWDLTDSSPASTNAKGNAKLLSSQSGASSSGHGRGNKATGIKSGGDGMGGKKGQQRSWGFGEESDSG